MALTALAVTAWRQGDVELVRELARAGSGRGGRTGHNWYYVAAATAALEAWVAWRDHRTEQVIALGTEALELWKSRWRRTHFAAWPSSRLPLLTSTWGKQKGRLTRPDKRWSRRRRGCPTNSRPPYRAACEAWDQGEPEKAAGLSGKR